ncbi:MAG: hypothetical protein K0R08_313 [Solimicrobium sp.]|jgi:hypothetical protein|nr:hypothetical protein [Solimicrobium sp.]
MYGNFYRRIEPLRSIRQFGVDILMYAGLAQFGRSSNEWFSDLKWHEVIHPLLSTLLR